MEFICRSGYNYLDKMTKIFKLDQDNSYLAGYVQLDRLKSKKLKETAVIIYTLKLQYYFDSTEIFLPLIVNDQLQVIETYVGDDASLQHQYVSFLADICGLKEEDLQNMIR